MKLMIAKIVYYTGIVLMIGIGLGLIIGLTWYIITTIPFFLAVLGAFALLVGVGMLYGWAETVINNDKRYSSR
jgi:predicted ABC-type sugar transport system permease subunit